MNKRNVVNTILNDYYKSKTFKFTICYIIFGVLIFTFSNMELTYINMIYYIMGHPYLIAFFLIPVTVFTSMQTLNILNNKCLLLSVENRNELFKLYFYAMIKNVIIIFFIFLFTTILFTNLFSNRNSFIQVDPYYPEINNLVGLIISLLKLLAFTISITLLNTSVVRIKKGFIIFVIDILFLISFLGYIPNQIIYLFPSYYVGYSYQFSSLISNVSFSLLYLILSFIPCYCYFRYIIIKKDYL